MANRQITQDVYNRLVAAYREQPEVHKFASEAAGVNWRTARRGWELGWAPRLPWAPAIKDVILNEQKEARARLIIEGSRKATEDAQAATKTPESIQLKAREDAVDTLMQEAKLIRAARENTLALMATTQSVMKGVVKLAPQAYEIIQNAKLTPMQIAAFFRQLASLMKDANECAMRALQLERLRTGEPTEIIGVTGVSMDDAERETRHTLALIEEAKKLGVIPSGEGNADGNGSNGNGGTPSVH